MTLLVAALGVSIYTPKDSRSGYLPLSSRDTVDQFYGEVPPTETLLAPITLTTGQTLENKRYRVDVDNFAWTSVGAAIYVAGPNVTIRNVGLIGSETWLARWEVFPEEEPIPIGLESSMVGIRVQGDSGDATNLRILDVYIEGFPRAGIYITADISDGIIRGYRSHHNWQGIAMGYQYRSYGVLIENIRITDTWGRAEVGTASAKRPGEYIGSDGLAMSSLSDSILRDIEVTGEQLASMKLVNFRNVDVSDFRGVGVMIQGTNDLDPCVFDGCLPSTGVTLRDFTVDKRLGSGHWVDSVNAIQLVWHNENLTVKDCIIYGDEKPGNAILLAVDTHLTLTGCTIGSFNFENTVPPATQPQGAALAVIDGTDGDLWPPPSTWNLDFESVNTFVDQDVKLYVQ